MFYKSYCSPGYLFLSNFAKASLSLLELGHNQVEIENEGFRQLDEDVIFLWSQCHYRGLVI